jgi:lysophospholipase L1-like esterase
MRIGKGQKVVHVGLEEYERVYDDLLRQTRPGLKGLVLMTPFFVEPDRREAMRARMDQYGDAVRRLAARHDAVCVDLQAAFDRMLAHLHPMSLAWDRVHPNQAGHMVIARAFLAAVGFAW